MKLTIGENIRRFRKEHDLTQEALAERLGVTYQSVSRWENGTTYPEIDRENNVYGHPTMVFLKDGVEMERHAGFLPADAIRSVIAKYMY